MDARELLTDIKNNLQFYNDSIREVSKDIVENKVSDYPIFIAHQIDIQIGELILNKDDFDTTWSISVTTLEDLIALKIIDKAIDFKKNYKPASTHICVLLISEKGANFIFQPYRQ